MADLDHFCEYEEQSRGLSDLISFLNNDSALKSFKNKCSCSFKFSERKF